MAKKKRLLILDANALIHRAYHALPPLTSPRGAPVGALYGLCLTLLNVLKTFAPTHAAAAFDRPGKTARHARFPAYKATRARADDELVAQIARAPDIFRAFGIPTLDAAGYEADDVIGTLTAQAAREDIESVIVTGDQDTLQLIGPQTRAYLLRRGIRDTVILGPREVVERFGLRPEQMIDFKALRGDPSDNIPGVRGIGEKTATELLQKYATLEGMYAHLDEIPEAIKKKLVAGKKDAAISRDLVTIHRSVPLRAGVADLSLEPPDRRRVIALFQELGFSSLLPRIPDAGPSGSAGTAGRQGTLAAARADPRARRRTTGYALVRTAQEARRVLAALRASKGFVFDTETDVLDARTADLHGVSFAVKAGAAWYVPASSVPLFKAVFEDPRIPKWGHNLKYDIEALARVGIRVAPVAFDTMLASYVLAPGTRAHSLNTLAFTILGREMIPITALIGAGKEQKPLSAAPLGDVAEYSCEDADMTLRLVKHFQKALKGEGSLRRVFADIEMPLVPVLAHMELAGVGLDVRVLRRLSRALAGKLRALERRIHALAGVPFNINSPPQLREALFTKLRLPTEGIGRTQSGYSTAAEELDKLSDAHPIIPKIKEYRELAKIKNTYLDTLPELVDPATGRVYTHYNQTVAATGRLSSDRPNLQNIPIRSELGREIRTAFVAERGRMLVAADYSQLELRIAAHIADDAVMQAAFRAGKDIHRETAAFAFDVPPERVTSEQRRRAKTLNFGVLYGMGPQAFARAAGIQIGEAQAFIDEYMRTYRGVAEYMEEAAALAASQGYVETIYGRRRYLPEIRSRTPQVRSAAARMAMNHPIQGTESDIIKRAMRAMFERMEAGRAPFTDVRMILQVHDELVFEVPAGQAERFAAEVKAVMEGMENLRVPIVVDVRVGENWGEMRPVA